MVILLPYHLFIYLCDLLLIQLGMRNLAIIANLFPILSSIRDLTTAANLFPVLGIKDSILLAYLFLLFLSLRSLAISLHLLILRDPTIGICLSTISLLPLIIKGYLLIMLLLL